MKVAFVTCSSKPGITPDDELTAQVLRGRGAAVTAIPWDSNFQEWHSFDRVVIRSAWNYHLKPDAFRQWLLTMEEKHVRFLNAPNVVRQNMHKGYLLDLATKGVDIPDTRIIRQGREMDLIILLNDTNWETAVVKPAVSATAHNTFVVRAAEAQEDQQRFSTLLKQSDVVVQRFVDAIQVEGEWSIMFFGKQLSHAVLKHPKKNDFRVQNDFGGTAQALTAPPLVIEAAKKIIMSVREPLAYARVDGVVSGGKFLLMELELIEPVLFLAENPAAPEAFANAITAA